MPATTCTLLKSAVCRLAAAASWAGSTYSMKVQVRRARTGTPLGRNMMNRWFTRLSTHRNCSDAMPTTSTGGACRSESSFIRPATWSVWTRTSCLTNVEVS